MYECQCTCFLLLQSFLEPRDSSENSSKRDDLHLACLQLHAKQFMEAMLGRNMHRCNFGKQLKLLIVCSTKDTLV